ncbi:MAG: ComEA family DNA-binding protein, partial [Solirubrobacterales bacterium]
APRPERRPQPEPAAEPARPGLDFQPPAASEAASASGGAEPAGDLNINSASYEELRGLGLSVTQTGRVLAHRERAGGFSDLDELDQIPGFPRAFLAEIKRQLTL